MDFDNYQLSALDTAQYPEAGIYNEEYSAPYEPFYNEANYVYPALGLVGEAGEVAEKIKKIIRDRNGDYTDEDILEIKKELGDVLWYVAVLANEFEISLLDIAKTNIAKLQSRKERGKIQGNGDNR